MYRSTEEYINTLCDEINKKLHEDNHTKYTCLPEHSRRQITLYKIKDNTKKIEELKTIPLNTYLYDYYSKSLKPSSSFERTVKYIYNNISTIIDKEERKNKIKDESPKKSKTNNNLLLPSFSNIMKQYEASLQLYPDYDKDNYPLTQIITYVQCYLKEHNLDCSPIMYDKTDLIQDSKPFILVFSHTDAFAPRIDLSEYINQWFQVAYSVINKYMNDPLYDEKSYNKTMCYYGSTLADEIYSIYNEKKHVVDLADIVAKEHEDEDAEEEQEYDL